MKPFACSRRTAGVERMSADHDWDYEWLKDRVSIIVLQNIYSTLLD